MIQDNHLYIKKYYINLKSRVDRKDALEKNLTSLGFDFSEYERIDAFRDDDFGGIGCCKSHIATITKYLLETQHKYCFIIEDDFRFLVNSEKFNDIFNDFILSDLEWNVFLLSGTSVVPFETSGNYLQIFQSNSASGYIFKRDYAISILNNFYYSLDNMIKLRNITNRDLIYQSFAIDQTWVRLQRCGGWYKHTQIIGHQEVGFSDIENRVTNYLDISN